MSRALLRMIGIAKRFPGVQALANVSLEVNKGEVHGLLGENGAGKSTLLKILSGAIQPDSGTIEFAGSILPIPSPEAAQALGIATIYQEFNLIPSMTVAENIFLGREPGAGPFISWADMRRATRRLSERYSLDLPPTRLVHDLSVAQQQMVEIARALSTRSHLIIMDEPTSALSDKETQRLFAIMRDLRSEGISIIFVTHRLSEVLRICDRITVLRDGKPSGTSDIAGLTVDRIIRMMVGRSAAELFEPLPERIPGEIVLKVSALSRRGTVDDPRDVLLDDVSFELRRGEILGIAGLIGSGRTELARCLFGADPKTAGETAIDGQPVEIRTPQDAIARGIGLVPEDRQQQALFLDLAVRENLSITALGNFLRFGFVKQLAERAMVETYRKSLNIRMVSAEQKVKHLSGGNQQKVVLARWLALKPRILIVDEPTRGIDVGAKSEVHQLLHQMATGGIAIIAISSELPEILAISDRIMTMRAGRITGEVARKDANEQRLMQLMTMGSSQPASL
jgi:ABC-type sugar transport system ATPase subunit